MTEKSLLKLGLAFAVVALVACRHSNEEKLGAERLGEVFSGFTVKSLAKIGDDATRSEVFEISREGQTFKLTVIAGLDRAQAEEARDLERRQVESAYKPQPPLGPAASSRPADCSGRAAPAFDSHATPDGYEFTARMPANDRFAIGECDAADVSILTKPGCADFGLLR